MRNRTLEFIDLYKIADEHRIPMSVTIELNTTCNLRCEHCYIPEWNNPGLSFDQIRSVFEQLRILGTFELVLTGGEVFSRPDALRIIELARTMGFEVIVFTNGTRITQEIAQKLSELYIGLVSISIFSLDPNVHDSITKRAGSLKKVLETVDLLQHYSVPLQLKSVIMKKNLASIRQLRDYCNERGIDYLATPYLFPKANGDSSNLGFRLDGSEMNFAVEIYDEIIGFQESPKNPNDLMCPPLLHSFGIAADGTMTPCNTMFYSVGNVLDKPIKEIWESQKLRRIQSLTISDVSGCASCLLSAKCVRSAGNALLETGNMLAESPVACSVTKARR